MPDVFKCSRWEDTDYVVSILPEGAKPWCDVPIGPLVGEREGRTIADWLGRGGFAAIRDIITARLATTDTEGGACQTLTAPDERRAT